MKNEIVIIHMTKKEYGKLQRQSLYPLRYHLFHRNFQNPPQTLNILSTSNDTRGEK